MKAKRERGGERETERERENMEDKRNNNMLVTKFKSARRYCESKNFACRPR